MPKTKDQKKVIFTELQKLIGDSRSVVFATFNNIKVKAQHELRNGLRDAGVTFRVVKKTLVSRALGESGHDGALLEEIRGNIGIASSLNDEVLPAKILAKAAKDNGQILLHFGILSGKLIDAAGVKMLSALPSKEELLGKLVGALASPMRGFLNVLQGNQRNLLTVLNQIKRNK